MKEYHTLLFFGPNCPKGEWQIIRGTDFTDIIFRHPYLDCGEGTNVPPFEVRQKYEALLGREEFINYDEPQSPNIVEVLTYKNDCGWDQPCAFGHRVEQHAVYCHNEKWLYAPRKCHRNRSDYPHEKCRGFKPNPSLHHILALIESYLLKYLTGSYLKK
jgi:hypothetical protein